jgi:hypothetical protein
LAQKMARSVLAVFIWSMVGFPRAEVDPNTPMTASLTSN